MAERIEDLMRRGFGERQSMLLDDARETLTAAVALGRAEGTQILLARALAALGQIERDLHNVDLAIAHYEEAVSIYRAEGASLRLAHAVRHLGDIYRQARKNDASRACYEEALAIYRSHVETDTLDLANAIRGFALLMQETGEREKTKMLWQEAKTLYTARNVQGGVDESSRRIEMLEMA